MGLLNRIRRAPKQSEDQLAPPPPQREDQLSPLEKQLAELLVAYGRTSDTEMLDQITPFYMRAVDELPRERRIQLLLFIIECVEQRSLSVNALMPFILRDTDSQVISTAALHAAGVYPQSDGDPLDGVRELAALARAEVRQGNEARAAAILAGLALLGDRRVLACLGPCWRALSSDGRKMLANSIRDRSYAGIVDWLVSWLEECEGDEFGAVAAAVRRFPTAVPGGEIIDVRRAMPVWSAGSGEVITVTHRWSLEAYADRLRPRLLQIAADEQSPRVMHDVLKHWGIDYTKRYLDEVRMRPSGGLESQRPLLPLTAYDGTLQSRVLDTPALLEDRDFIARDGQILLCWAIFNPFGPTWNCLGRMPTEDPAIDCLFFRMLNPFGQQACIVGLVARGDAASGVTVGRLVVELFAREDITTTGGEEVHLLGFAVPDVVEVAWTDSAFGESIQQALLASPHLRQLEVVRAIREIPEFNGRPWDRASAEMASTLSRMTRDGLIPPLEREGEATDAAIIQWFALVTAEDHWLGELLNYPPIWHGAIDNAPPTTGYTAFTYWQLDDFLCRYGYTRLRDIASAYFHSEPRS